MNITQFINQLSELRSSSTFVSLIGYKNEHNEIANYSVNYNISYINALKRSIAILEKVNPINHCETQAKQELLNSFYYSLDHYDGTETAYSKLMNTRGEYINGMKLHNKTNTVHLYGLVNHKRVIQVGNYPHINSQELTKVKSKLRKLTPVGRFRQFILTPNRVKKISVGGLSLLPPSVNSF